MKIATFFISILAISCANNGERQANSELLDGKTKEQWKKDYVDSVIKETTKNSLFDTAGLYHAPVKILKARLVEREYSNYKDISLTFKNVSKKKISAIRFKWYGENAFNEPADMGSGFVPGFGGGFDDDPLPPGRTRTSSWNILSNDGNKVILAWPYEVVFADGAKWDLGKGDLSHLAL